MIRKISHFPFIYRPFDSLLAFVASGLPDQHFVRKLIPANDEYNKNTLRYCTRDSVRYCLDLNDYQAWLIYFHFETDSSSPVLKYVKPGDVVIDIGGNIGQTALQAATKVTQKGKVISFEPYPDTYRKFKNNLSLNPTISNVELVDYGLGDKPGSFDMFQACNTNSGANRISPNSGNMLEGEEMIKVITLDSFIDSNRLNKIDLIKLDVEGFEMKVLRGAEETISNYRPVLFIEVDDANLQAQGDSARDIFDYCKNFHYDVKDINTGEKITDHRALIDCHTDILCHYSNP